MKLFVPELGTLLKLREDWSFTLYREHRNKTLMKPIGIEDRDAVGAFEAAVKGLIKWLDANPSVGYYMQSPSYWDDGKMVWHFYPKYPYKGEKGLEFEDRCANLVRLNEEANKMSATIVAGTVLKLDRIYVRKGASEFSSLSFVVQSSPDERLDTKKKPRFWAKLEDCNNIEFELA